MSHLSAGRGAKLGERRRPGLDPLWSSSIQARPGPWRPVRCSDWKEQTLARADGQTEVLPGPEAEAGEKGTW